jgi:hypothetical protein
MLRKLALCLVVAVVEYQTPAVAQQWTSAVNTNSEANPTSSIYHCSGFCNYGFRSVTVPDSECFKPQLCVLGCRTSPPQRGCAATIRRPLERRPPR